MTQAHRSAETALQLSGERMFMTQAAARQLMENPVQVTRGQITRITLIVPAFEEPNRQGRYAYLVAQIPQAKVQELLRHVGTLPETQRAGFVRDYLRANQQAMITNYIGNRRARFRFDGVEPQAVAAPQPAAVPTPRRVAEPAPRRAATPRRTTPQPVVTPAPVERPVPGPRPAPRVELPALPAQVTGGSGTRSRPYEIRLREGRSSRGLGASVVNLPIQFRIGLGGGDTTTTIYVNVSVTASQLANSRLNATSAELRQVIQACFVRRAAEHQTRVENTSRRDALNRIPATVRTLAQRLGEQDAELGEYVRSH
jgi:hypothetical protein